MRKFRALSVVLSAIVLICSLAVCSKAEYEYDDYYDDDYQYSIYIYDEADLFSDKETERLIDTMAPIAENYGHACILTLLDCDYYDTKSYAEAFTIQYYDKENLVLFIIDMDNRELYMNFEGRILRDLGTSTADIITDNVYRYATDEEYFECATEAMSEALYKLEGGNLTSSMKILSNACIAVVFALLLTYFIARAVSSTMKASNSEMLDSMYHQFKFTDTKSVLDHTSREYSPQSSGSSGGHGGGGGHSGGGGGGGHGF